MKKIIVILTCCLGILTVPSNVSASEDEPLVTYTVPKNLEDENPVTTTTYIQEPETTTTTTESTTTSAEPEVVVAVRFTG